MPWSGRPRHEGSALASFDHVIMWTPARAAAWTALGEAPGTYIQTNAPYPDTAESRFTSSPGPLPRDGPQHGAAPCERAARARTRRGSRSRSAPAASPSSTATRSPRWAATRATATDPLPSAFLSPLFSAEELNRLGWLDPGRDPDRHRDRHVRPRPAVRHGPRRPAPAHPARDAGHRGRPERVAAPLGMAHGGAAVRVARRHVGHLPGRIAGDERRHRPLCGGWRRGHRVRPGATAGPAYVIDAHPATVGRESWDVELLDTPLGVGDPAELVDPATGYQIGLVSRTATVRASPSRAPRRRPRLLDSPVITSVGPAGGAVTVRWAAPAAPAISRSPATPSAPTLVAACARRSRPRGRARCGSRERRPVPVHRHGDVRRPGYRPVRGFLVHLGPLGGGDAARAADRLDHPAGRVPDHPVDRRSVERLGQRRPRGQL